MLPIQLKQRVGSFPLHLPGSASQSEELDFLLHLWSNAAMLSVRVSPHPWGGTDRPTRLGQGHLSVGTPKPLHHAAGQAVMQIK